MKLRLMTTSKSNIVSTNKEFWLWHNLRRIIATLTSTIPTIYDRFSLRLQEQGPHCTVHVLDSFACASCLPFATSLYYSVARGRQDRRCAEMWTAICVLLATTCLLHVYFILKTSRTNKEIHVSERERERKGKEEKKRDEEELCFSLLFISSTNLFFTVQSRKY